MRLFVGGRSLRQKLEMRLALASSGWQVEKCPSAHRSCPDLCFGCALSVQVEVVRAVRLGEAEDASQQEEPCPLSTSGLPAAGRELGCHVSLHLLRRSAKKKRQQDLGKLKKAVKSLPLSTTLQHQAEWMMCVCASVCGVFVGLKQVPWGVSILFQTVHKSRNFEQRLFC